MRRGLVSVGRFRLRVPAPVWIYWYVGRCTLDVQVGRTWVRLSRWGSFVKRRLSEDE